MDATQTLAAVLASVGGTVIVGELAITILSLQCYSPAYAIIVSWHSTLFDETLFGGCRRQDGFDGQVTQWHGDQLQLAFVRHRSLPVQCCIRFKRLQTAFVCATDTETQAIVAITRPLHTITQRTTAQDALLDRDGGEVAQADLGVYLTNVQRGVTRLIPDEWLRFTAGKAHSFPYIDRKRANEDAMDSRRANHILQPASR